MNIELPEIISNASPHERYIILMNNTLLERNKEHILKIETMENDLSRLYECLNKAETRAKNLNGLLTDLHHVEANLRI